MLRLTFTLPALCLSAALLSSPAAAQSYTFRTIDINPLDQTVLLSDVGGTILGWDIPSNGNPTCTLIQGATRTVISDPNATVTYCHGISSAGTVAGYYQNSNGNAVGFTYSNGTYTDFSLPNGAQSPLPLAISTSGIVTGYYYDINNKPVGFVLNGSTVRTFRIAGATNIFPVGINNRSEVAIQELDTGGHEHCLVKSGATFTELTYPAATQTVCHGINNNGQIVGSYTDSLGANNGFAYDPATLGYYTINYPGMAVTHLEGITNSETLVGYYQATSGAPDQGLKAVGSFP